jgi:hypothetical protein
MGIQMTPTPEYAARKLLLSPKRREFLEYVEEDIGSNPDKFRFERDGTRFRYVFEELAGWVAFELPDTTSKPGTLIDFAFLDQA